MDDKYKVKISDLKEHLSKMVMDDLGELGIRVGSAQYDKSQSQGEVRMKVPGTNFDVRINEPPEKIEMVAHAGECLYCHEIVKMMRDRVTFKLQPNDCRWIMCGQRYYVDIGEEGIDAWELMQWRQKGQTFAMGGDICPGRKLE